VALRARTEAIAKHLTEFLRKTDRFAKTIVFCVDQEHADEMRRALGNLNADLVREHPNYVCRVTAEEGDIGRGHADRFQDVETRTPVILTTSQLLTTGVDAPTCKNIVLARIVGSMTDFKQIIGRGTRVRDDYGKLWFNILDYTGSATRMFADPDFDGDPTLVTEQELVEGAQPKVVIEVVEPPESVEGGGPKIVEPPTAERPHDRGRIHVAASSDVGPVGKVLDQDTYVTWLGKNAEPRVSRSPSMLRSVPPWWASVRGPEGLAMLPATSYRDSAERALAHRESTGRRQSSGMRFWRRTALPNAAFALAAARGTRCGLAAGARCSFPAPAGSTATCRRIHACRRGSRGRGWREGWHQRGARPAHRRGADRRAASGDRGTSGRGASARSHPPVSPDAELFTPRSIRALPRPTQAEAHARRCSDRRGHPERERALRIGQLRLGKLAKRIEDMLAATFSH
jgi:hypothetical protein